MKQDTIDFLEALVFTAIDDDDTIFENKTIHDFAPAFTEAAEKFIDAFRAHLEAAGFPVEKLDTAERSFGGNVYFSLSGHGCGFFDDNDHKVAGLHKRLKQWAGGGRFFELDSMLEVDESGKIDLAFIPEALEEYRQKIFGVPVGEPEGTPQPPKKEEAEVKYLPHTPGKWTYEGEGWINNTQGGSPICTLRIGTGGYGEIEVIDGTNEPDGNLNLMISAPLMLQTLIEVQETLKMARRYMPKSIKNRDSFAFEVCNAAVGTAILKAKGGAQ